MIRIGTCGYSDFKPGGNWKEHYPSKLAAYADRYRVLELNKSFYGLPMEKTARRWREEAGEELEIIVKAWMAITHPTDSMVWRKRKEKLSEQQLQEFGNLHWNESVQAAWEQTVGVAQAMKARCVLVQTPAGFGYSREHERQARNFFHQARRADLGIAWEPRGDWLEEPAAVKRICKEEGVIHATDVLRRKPLSDARFVYCRLHGLNEKEFNYRYTYSRKELEQLAEELTALARESDELYCLFNNEGMYENADSLKEMLAGE
jgi:uncharacterized protein YecE (DUF72 family)